MKKIWIRGKLIKIGTEEEGSGGVVFCTIPTTDGSLKQTFKQEDVLIVGDAVRVPAYCDELAPIGAAETLVVQVQPEYLPFLWSVTGVPPSTLDVSTNHLVEA